MTASSARSNTCDSSRIVIDFALQLDRQCHAIAFGNLHAAPVDEDVLAARLHDSREFAAHLLAVFVRHFDPNAFGEAVDLADHFRLGFDRLDRIDFAGPGQDDFFHHRQLGRFDMRSVLFEERPIGIRNVAEAALQRR